MNSRNLHHILSFLKRCKDKDMFFVKINIFFILLSLQSCNNEDDLPLIMKDGTRIILKSEDVVSYSNETDFLRSFTPLFPCKYSFISSNSGPFLQNISYSIEGYDDRFIGGWEKVKFNDWIIKYGLQPNTTYYCATIKYIIYLPIPPLDEEYVPLMPMDNMGYSSWSNNPSFDIEYSSNYKKYIFYTYLRYIGYNENLEGEYIVLPLINKLIWNFTVTK